MLCKFIEIALRHGCSPVNLLHILRTPFPKNISRRLLLLYMKWIKNIHALARFTQWRRKVWYLHKTDDIFTNKSYFMYFVISFLVWIRGYNVIFQEYLDLQIFGLDFKIVEFLLSFIIWRPSYITFNNKYTFIFPSSCYSFLQQANLAARWFMNIDFKPDFKIPYFSNVFEIWLLFLTFN